MRGKLIKGWFLVAVSAVVVAACAAKDPVRPALTEGPGWTTINNNLHQIDGPPAGPEAAPAYRVYRSGAPSRETFAKWCAEFKIDRVIVMSGDAKSHELKYQAEGICPEIKVIYDVAQDLTPLSDGFLNWFDRQVEEARRDNAGLLFRCQTGSHRAGRVAAYYQMKYQGLSAAEAIAVMNHQGMLMPLFAPVLVPQVRALADYLNHRPCSQPRQACVILNSNKWVP